MYAKSIGIALLLVLTIASGLWAGTDCGFLEAGRSSFICPGDTVVLRVYSASDPWHWEDGSSNVNLGSDSFLVVTQPGLYIVRLDNYCAMDYFMVWPMEDFAASLLSSDSFCPGKPYYFNVPYSSDLDGFLWDDGPTNPTRTFYQPGQYGYSISSDCGQTKGVFELRAKQAPPANFPSEFAICPGDQLLLPSPIDDPVKVLWSDGSEEFSFSVANFGELSCEVLANNGCRYEYETEIIKRDDCECRPEIPNVFSPNGDGVNDGFTLQIPRCDFKAFSLSIYDRWGKECFATSSPTEVWDGGKYPEGVYYYLISYQNEGFPFMAEREYGSLLLMR